MKYKKILYPLLFSMVMVGCKTTQSSSSTSSESVFSISSENSTSEGNEKAPLQQFLQQVQEGFRLEGTYSFNKKDYLFDYTYVDGTTDALSIKLKQKDGELHILLQEETIFQDEQGWAYTENLNLSNEVEQNYAFTKEEKTFFHAHYLNPFSILSVDDFVLENNLYTFNTKKTKFFFSQFLSEDLLTFVTEVTLDVEHRTLQLENKNLKLQASIYTNDVKIAHLKPLIADEHQEKLALAFQNLGNQYVLDFENEDYHQKLYFSGRSIFIQGNANQTTLNEWEDTWINTIVSDPDHLYSLYTDLESWYVDSQLLDDQDTYATQTCHFEQFKSVFFDYQDDGSFISKDSYGDLIASYIVPMNLKNILYNRKNIQITIFLSEDGKLDRVYLDDEKGSIAVFRFTEFTSLPFELVDEPVNAS